MNGRVKVSCKGKCYIFERYLQAPKVYDKLNYLCEAEGLVYGTLQKQLSGGINLEDAIYYCCKDYRIWKTDLINKLKEKE